MPKRPWPGRAFSVLVVAGALGFASACTSEPCVGEACPNACPNGACDDADAGPSAPATTSGRFTPCSSSASCDEANGFACVAGSCRHACRSHFDCGGVAVCDTSALGEGYCELTSPPTEPGGYYSRCPTGECDAASGFLCVGAGVGDTESYCTTDCASDADCPSGFLCDAISNGAGDTRSVCVPRGFCAECENDADCRSVPGGVCARDASGAKFCTQVCDPSRNSCPWGSATECALTDDELGAPTCQHRSGSCGGAGNACDPCQRDTDCTGGNGICIVSSYSGERFCVDRSVPCSCAGIAKVQDFCAGANGCPEAPNGLRMICYDASPPGEGICVGVNLPGSSSSAGQLSCWR
jgi:hypothetical protein